jgi:signal peptidase II
LVIVIIIIGGGFSNLADRVFRGDMVVDFMNVGIGRLRTGVFNVADLSIVVGVVVFLVGSLLDHDSSDASLERERPADQEPIP